MDEKFKWIISGIVISITIMGFFGVFISLGLTNITMTHEIKMDDNTLEYLIAHDYCVQMSNPPYDSNESTKMFIGDCEYLNYSLFN